MLQFQETRNRQYGNLLMCNIKQQKLSKANAAICSNVCMCWALFIMAYVWMSHACINKQMNFMGLYLLLFLSTGIFD